MINHITNLCIDELSMIRNQANYLTCANLAHELLDMLEFQGMLPPEAADFNLGNSWEPENEEK